MDVRLSPEQQALRDAAAQVVDRLGPGTVGALADEERQGKLDAAVAASGWRELRDGTDDGTPLASGVEAALVAEELARGLADVPFLGPTLAAELRRLAGAPPATTPETVLLAPDAASMARADGDRRPAGVAVDAAGSATALLLVPGEDGGRLAAVALAGTEARLDLTRRTAPPDPTGALIPVPGATVPVGRDGRTVWLALGLALTCAELVGTMRGAVRLARDHAVHRRQYDAPIGSFQAVQHLLADAHVATEGSRSVALHAAWAVDALAPAEALAAAATAKAYCARAARDVCETAIQVHGGMGNTWECLAHVHLRRALLSTEILGDAGTNLDRVLACHGIAQPATGGVAPGSGGTRRREGGDGGLR